MPIHYELPVADFLQFLLSCVQDRKTGIVFFFSNTTDWGKIVFNQGNIQSVRFRTLKGMEALPSIRGLQLVQYNFRPDDPSRLSPVRDQDVNNERFCAYFGLALASHNATIVEEDTKQAAVVISKQQSITNQRRHAKILIADDSPTARKAISRILTEAGFQVVEARNGFEALGQLENERPDLLLLDLIMPGIDGYSVLKAIERTQGTERIPIVVLTSRDGLLDKLKGMALSCDAYLTKPVQSNTLLEIANKYLPDA